MLDGVNARWKAEALNVAKSYIVKEDPRLESIQPLQAEL